MSIGKKKSLCFNVPIDFNQLGTEIDNADVFHQMFFHSGSIVALVETEKYSIAILVFGEHKSCDPEDGEYIYKNPKRLLELLEENDHQDFIIDSCWLAYDVYDKNKDKLHIFSENDTYGSIKEIFEHITDERINERIANVV